MSTTSRRTATQPRPTKASALRSSSVQVPNTKKASDTAPSTKKSVTTATSSERPNPHSKARASEGVRAFMSNQRSRLNKAKQQQQQQPDDEVDPSKMKPSSGNVMTGAQRYSDNFQDTSLSSSPNTSNLKSVIQQAKSSGRMNLAHRHLEKVPDQILNMYHVDPNSIVVDFSSSGGDAWYDAVELTKFVAAFNDITVMDERIGTEFGALTLLDFRNNRLQGLPSSLAQLERLTTLHLPYNQFDGIPDVILQLTNLRELNMAHNQLKQLPSNIGTFHRLEILDLGNNMIGPDLPEEMSLLTSLRKLHMDNNQLASLSAQIVSGWGKLDDLSMAHNRLTRFVTGNVEADCVLPSLLRLDIRHNNLKKMTPNIRLPKLKELLLADNALTTVLDGDNNELSASTMDYSFLQYCDELLTLDVGSNQWTEIPNAVLDLTQLQRLDIGGNQLRGLPSDLGRLPNLIALTWQGNPLRSVPRNISMMELIESLRVAQISQQESTTSTTTTDGSNNNNNDDGSTKTDQQDKTLPQLDERKPASLESTNPAVTTRTLNLSNQKLTELSESSINQHYGVQTIQLGNNELPSFSLMAVTRFSTTLVHLSLEKNKLTTFALGLPAIFATLKTLNLANNRLREISYDAITTNDEDKSKSAFPALTDLILNNNTLTELPQGLSTVILPSLRTLRCNSNRLTTINPDGLANLEVLDIANNDIATLPPALGLISSLRELTAYGNRFRVPQPSLLAQGTPAVMAFLKRRAGVATD
ncbi:hypothetical protein BCR42DRAFT_433534 [Absidia repens]|uniref:L domain-like protein n=1 Tax=Absidia repens TaxID=90262 RepID=A0A1X2ITU1_9FUNG|nr:hypothetical protein BCR42DRAFT_433534 [Absidia repens]